MPPLNLLRKELRPVASLAAPVVVAEVGWVSMQLVDIGMVGRLGPEAIGAVGVGSALFLAFGVFGDGPAARSRHARLAGPRRRRPQRVPALAAPRHLARAGTRDSHRPDRPRGRRHARRLGLRSARAAAGARLLRHRHAEPAAAAAVRGLPALPAGRDAGDPGHGHARHGQRRERGRQLGARLRQPGRAGPRRGRRRLGHLHFAQLHGGRAGRGGRPPGRSGTPAGRRPRRRLPPAAGARPGRPPCSTRWNTARSRR